ncbi:hypothetical protein JX266_006256 [Neoarthrinium moseri]|nr:hypothetical protein JX266_006256 [Neoarthrinium moseri]
MQGTVQVEETLPVHEEVPVELSVAEIPAIDSLCAWLDEEEAGRLVETNVRFDTERFTIGASVKLPRLQVFCPKGEPQALHFTSDLELPPTASSIRSMNFINYNLNQCLHGHSDCGRYQTEMKPGINDNWPRRMLVIDTAAATIRLADFEHSMRSKFVALSYCWGCESGHLIATKRTLPELRAGTAISQLPATLRDAVMVTVNLGSNLIWIDSLCIIQDDENDWNEEAGKMSTVYAQSLVTVIASSAGTCGDGFLSVQREQSMELSKVRINDRFTEVRARTLYDWGHHRGGPQSNDTARRQWLDPVDGRGWTLQERMLSARYINFTSGEVQWGCLSSRACECGQSLYGTLFEKLTPEEEWFSIVEEYCSRNLTKATDKLTALAGISRKMSLDLSWEWYGAGVWLCQKMTPFTARGLLWRRGLKSPMTSFSEGYIAPTFSWAALAGEAIHFPQEKFTQCTYPSEVVGVDMRLHTTDKFGRVKAGYLCMRGPLAKAELSWDASAIHDDLTVGIKIIGVDDSYHHTCRIDGLLEPVSLDQGRITVRRRVAGCVDAGQDLEGVAICLLPIITYELTYSTGNNGGPYSG